MHQARPPVPVQGLEGGACLCGHLPRGRVRPAQAKLHQGADPLLRRLHRAEPCRGGVCGCREVQRRAVRDHHCRHLRAASPRGRALRRDGGGERRGESGLGCLCARLDHRPGCAGAGCGVQGQDRHC
eukprot:Amastigsp_a174505_1858.p4 type:complete len:127 gc:universal Amastigsp_a174505_1858:389-769(+)